MLRATIKNKYMLRYHSVFVKQTDCCKDADLWRERYHLFIQFFFSHESKKFITVLGYAMIYLVPNYFDIYCVT